MACEIKSKPITRRQILDSSKLKEFADDNFKFDENGRKLSKRVGNTVGKGEIARYEQFLLFPQCFQKACFPEAAKGFTVWECVELLTFDSIPKNPMFLHVCCTTLLKTQMSNISFSHGLFYLFRDLSTIFIKFKIVVCKLIQFRRVSNLLIRKLLKHISVLYSIFWNSLLPALHIIHFSSHWLLSHKTIIPTLKQWSGIREE